MMSAETATEAYNKDTEEVEAIISELKKQLKMHKKMQKRHPDWGYVGDLRHVKVLLNEIVEFMGGEE